MTGHAARGRLHEQVAARLAGASKRTTRTEGPLSHAQERLWFLDRLDPGNSVYNTGFAIRLTGRLDRDALAEAFATVVRRNGILRTTFGQDEAGNARQHVRAECPVPPAILKPEGGIDRACQDFLTTPFDLTTGPVMRAGLIALDDTGTDHVLVVGTHHIVSDGWSHPILVDELRTAYNTGTAAAAPRPQYIDFADRQRRADAQEAFGPALRFWRDRLADTPIRLALPRDRTAAVDGGGHRGETVAVVVPAERAARIRKLATACDTTEFAVLLAAYQALLARYSGQDRFLVGFPAANRHSAEEFDTIGFFVNTIAFPADLRDAPSLADLVRRVGRDLLAVYEHQHAPYEQVVRDGGRDGATADPIEAFLAWQNVPEAAGEWTGLRAEEVPIAWPTAKFDLTLSLSQRGEEIRGYFEYRTAVFDRQTIEQLAANWTALLGALLDAPDRPLSTVDLVAGDPVLPTADWLAATDYDQAELTRVDAAVERWARSRPDVVAVSDGTSELTWAQLRGRAAGLAGRLIERGVRAGEVVAVCCGRGVDGVVAVLAVLRAGAAFLPLDPTAPGERHARMIDECDVRIAVVDHSAPDLGVERIAVSDNGSADAAVLPETGLDHLAYVIYTSGSTGAPKGVLVAHRGLANLIRTHVTALDLSDDDVVLLAASPTFDPWVFQTFIAFAAGARLVVAGEDQVAGAPLADLLADKGVTVLNVTPTTAATLPEVALPALRRVVVGGDSCRLDIARRWAKDRVLFNAYGPTEVTVSATLARFHHTVDHVHIGTSFPNVRVYLLDQRGRPVAPGMIGEICVGGVGVGWGYVKQPALTADRFRPDPFAPGARLYRTGDLGRWRADGGIDFLGRRDRQVKIRGHRIEPAEIEAVLTATPGVGEAVVVPHTDPTGDTRLIAYITGAEHAERAHERARLELPRWMVPSLVVGLDRLPTRNGKIDRAALPSPEWTAAEPGEPPSTPVERDLADIWARLLPARPARDDDFFRRGGHSLLATRLVFAIAETFGVDMSLRTVFEQPTLAGQAAWIERAVQADLAALPDDAALLAELELLENLDDDEAAALLGRTAEGETG